MALPRRAQQHCTYADYRGWSSDERYELIDGVAYAMGPAPLRGHQKVLLAIARQVGDARRHDLRSVYRSVRRASAACR